MRFFLLLAPLLLLGCASGGASSPGPRDVVLVSGESGTVALSRYADAGGAVQQLPVSAEQVWPAVEASYRALDIPVAMVDRPRGILGNQSFLRVRSMAGQPLSRFFSCGYTATGAPIADEYRLEISLVTAVRERDGGTNVETRANAMATSAVGTQSVVSCDSRGALEQRLNAELIRQLGAA